MKLQCTSRIFAAHTLKIPHLFSLQQIQSCSKIVHLLSRSFRRMGILGTYYRDEQGRKQSEDVV